MQIVIHKIMNENELKNRSEIRLKELGITVPAHLPEIESDGELNPKSAYEVAKKIAALGYVIGMGYGADTNDLISKIENHSLSKFVSTFEWERLKAPSLLTEQDKINFKWLAECVYAFSWCLHLLDLEPLKQCPNNLADIVPPGVSPDKFIDGKTLRDWIELKQEADFYYRLHWYTSECRLIGKESPIGEGIIMERRRALDWVIGVSDDWDDMPSDT
jgi:hypothetical protein